jgi:hypothetical protein
LTFNAKNLIKGTQARCHNGGANLDVKRENQSMKNATKKKAPAKKKAAPKKKT